MSWIQWPVNAIDAAPDELPEDAECDGKDVARHPVCTKALALNGDALLLMLEYYDGNFVDIPTVQHEARLFSIFFYCIDHICTHNTHACI